MGNSGSHCIGKYTICILNLDLLGLRLSLAIITTKLKNIICHFLVCIFSFLITAYLGFSCLTCKLQIFSNFKNWLCVLSMHDGYCVSTCVWACLIKNFFFSFDFFRHLFKVFLFSFLFNFVWNILCRHLGLYLLLTIYFLFHTFFSFFVLFSSFTWCIICHISFTWCILCQHLGPTCHLLSLRHFILPWHSHRHFIFTLWSQLYKLHIHCKFTLFILFIYIFISITL